MSDAFLLGQIFRVPPVTRCLALSIVLVTLLVYTDTVSPYTLFYSPLFLKRFEVWRILTSFLYFGKPTLDVFMHIVFLYRYSRMLEEGCTGVTEYFWLVLVVSCVLFAVSNIYGIPTLGTAFSATITYIWTKRNPRAIVQIFGFVSFPAFYLPFILPGFMLLSRKSISIDDILGIAVGHVFYYFKDVYPRWGSNVLATPCWVKRLFGEHPVNCCRTQTNLSGGAKKGTTIAEGRARYEANKARSDRKMAENTRTEPLDDVTDVRVKERDGEDEAESLSAMEENPSHDESLFSINQSTAAIQESSLFSADVPCSVSDTLNLNSVMESQDETENQSGDEWSEKWGDDSSEITSE